MKSSYCNSGECIDVAQDEYGVSLIRSVGGLEFCLDVTPAEFTAFVKGVKAGEFDEFLEEAAPVEDSLKNFTPRGDSVQGVYGNAREAADHDPEET